MALRTRLERNPSVSNRCADEARAHSSRPNTSRIAAFLVPFLVPFLVSFLVPFLVPCLLFLLAAAQPGWTQGGNPAAVVANFEGTPVVAISFEGVPASRLAPLPGNLAQAVGKPLRAEDVSRSLRQLFATSLYNTLAVEATRRANGVALVFRGEPRQFIGAVSVYGAKGATMNTQLERASRLEPGTRFTQAGLQQAIEQMRTALADNGYQDASIASNLKPHPEEQLVDISFLVQSGPQARVGSVSVSGDSGMSKEQFERQARMKPGSLVEHETVNRALDNVLKHYEKQGRLEADVKLASEKYAAGGRTADFQFTANQGPVVKVQVEGAGIDEGRIHRLIPIFEEGTVDEDLLNEGNRRLRDYFQRLGYFDVKVNHQQHLQGGNQADELVNILYTVELGPRRRVQQVLITGNRYFGSATLKELLNVHAANTLDRHGAYSQALIAADISALLAVYRNNGFANARITAETSPPETGAADHSVLNSRIPLLAATIPFNVTYRIEEGQQIRVGSVAIEGNEHMRADALTPRINTIAGQLLSPENLAGDRNALLTEYLSEGFDQVAINVIQKAEAGDAGKVDVTFQISEGEQVFVRKVLLRGLTTTRRQTVEPALTLHPGDPLNETALTETQRNLYDYALFSEVDTAIENPTGGEPYKTILIQASEARRWSLTGGFGFEAQTGQPQNNCAGAIAGGVACNPNGKTGVSPRVIAAVTRNGLFGREQSVSLQGTYGLLEQSANFLYQVPRFEGHTNLGVSFNAGYANTQAVTTYVASRLTGGFRLTENFVTPGSLLSKANTFIYELDFRRVKVAASSLQVYPGEINSLATAVRVSGPSFTWIRDTRDSAMDAHRGTYTSFQDFVSAKTFGSQAEFNRIDTTNSSYYGFDKGRFVLARSTRYGQVRTFGSGSSALLPLPERLYAGGAISLRGFDQNGAGPRDPETGYPIGGAGALVNSTELRLPPPTLPWFGNTLSLVLFHDMGNVFTNAGDAWASALRVHQPSAASCKQDLNTALNPNPTPSGGPLTSTGQQGHCSFNYFSHTPGVGLRYHTPVGPIRFDFSYNLNPPTYPVNINYSLSPDYLTPQLNSAPHFNFFFSLGQTF
jgi:outer membrane protein assembly complex protein YaeT